METTMNTDECPHSNAELRQRVMELFADRRSVGREKLVIHMAQTAASIAECKAMLAASESDAFRGGAFDPPDIDEASVH
jgi:hypothetical protein